MIRPEIQKIVDDLRDNPTKWTRHNDSSIVRLVNAKTYLYPIYIEMKVFGTYAWFVIPNVPLTPQEERIFQDVASNVYWYIEKEYTEKIQAKRFETIQYLVNYL